MKGLCIVCEQEKRIPYANKNGFDVVRCGGCGTLFLHPLPEDGIARAVYSREYFAGATRGHGYIDYDADKEAMRTVFEKHVRNFEDKLGAKGKIFDVGAATGFFMKIAEARGWRTEGIDISEYAAERGRKDGLNIKAGTLERAELPRNTYDVVTMWDVIEHMSNPSADLLRVREMLRSNGLLAINTPDSGSLYAKILGSRWHLFVPPEHIWYFNRRSISKLLEKNGFEVVEIGCIGKNFTIEYVLYTLYRWQKFTVWQKLLSWFRNKRIGKMYVPINLRDNMYVLARKK